MATPAQLFQSFSRYPLGKQLFSRAVTRRAPYFASVSPLIEELRPGRCEVRVRKRRAVHNHIGTVHAIAMLLQGRDDRALVPGGVRDGVFNGGSSK